MKVRLLAPDSKMPNIAIMKISTYHKQKGDNVDWYNYLFDYKDTDILYISKVFSFTPDVRYLPLRAKIIKGGSGYDCLIKLPMEIEECALDYSLYPKCDYSIQFLSRGCIRHCPFCIVPLKEGLIKKVDPMDLNPDGEFIKLLDNNFFACKEWRENIEILKSYHQSIEFNQGIDLRILIEEHCEALESLNIKRVYCAWDNYNDKDLIIKKLRLLTKYIKSYKISCYVLVGFENKKIVKTDIERVMTLDSIGVTPFAMGYRDFNPNYKVPQVIKDFCRWVNMRSTFKTCTWQDYKKQLAEAKERGQLSLF